MLAEHGKVKQEKLTRKQLKEACKDTFKQTKIKLRTKWGTAIKYKVLMTFQLNDKDRREVAKVLALAVTPMKAKEQIILARRRIQERTGDLHAALNCPWSYRDISMVKDFECGVLQFKGLAVCLFYKRQCSEIEPEPKDPIPIGALENDDDIWARLDLFSKSPRQLIGDIREELIENAVENVELKHTIAVRDALLHAEEYKVKALQAKVNVLEAQLKVATTGEPVSLVNKQPKPVRRK